MGKIKQLPLHEVHKIAAGEVVERPANVVKELVENALDAGATSITLYIERGGRGLIRVLDNGYGMSIADAHMSIMHHATSKITTVDDLEHIATFGFRGEALSSIAAVSRMTLITKEEKAIEGLKLILHAGTLEHEESVAAVTGTDISVADLFFNVPARQKFLKSEETEWRTIHTLMQAFALCFPTHAFKIYHNDRLVMQCNPKADHMERACEIYDRFFADSLRACTAADASMGMKVQGALTEPQYLRYDRSQIFIFVNRRWVKNTKLTQAILKGYSGILPEARYPAAAIFIEIDPRLVDINIHPRKEEVSFLHPRKVEQALTHMVRSSLEHHVSLTLGFGSSQPVAAPIARSQVHPVQESVAQQNFFSRVAPEQPDQNRSAARFDQILESAFAAPTDALQGTSPMLAAVHESAVQRTASLPEPSYASHVQEASIVRLSPNYTLLGQLFSTYLLIENESGLVLIDQHAAHERILYELFASRFDDIAIAPLLFPYILTFSRHECDTILAHEALFAKYGIALDLCGDQQIAIRTMPVVFKGQSLEAVFKEVIAWLDEQTPSDEELFAQAVHHTLRASMACKAAVKAGDRLSVEQQHELIATISVTNNRFTCPHGRPTSWVISQYEIEKKFKRKL